MKNPFHNFHYLGVIAWIDAIFALFMLYPIFRCFPLHELMGALMCLGIGVIMACSSIISFSSCGQIRRLPFPTLLATLAGFVNIAFGLFLSYGSNNAWFLFLFMFMGCGNLISTLPKRRNYHTKLDIR